MPVDNITLALLSLKKDLEDYLDDQGWRRKYSMFLFGDSGLKDKELVLKRTQRNHVELPVIVLDTGTVRNDINELGTEFGQDLVTLTYIVIARESNQLRSLANLIRRRMNSRVFNIKNYSSPRLEKVGTGQLSDVFLTDVSDPDSNNIADRNTAVINMTLELNAESLT